MNNNQEKINSGRHGGARPGAGRPRGSTNKIKIDDLISSIESRAGMSFTDQIANNYMGAILREDWARVECYDRALLNKLVADKTDITVEEIGDQVENKKKAFIDALVHLNNINKASKDQ